MSKIKKNESKLWVLKSVADSEKSYQTVESYKDKIDTAYNYDNKVANSQRIKSGDYIILINKTHIIGFARLEAIRQEAGSKVISKCTECTSTTIEYRKTKTPKYRCNRGHTFEIPRKETVAITKYFAEYSNTFIAPGSGSTDSIRVLRPYYLSGYNRNMSMQLLDINALKLFPAVFEKLRDRQVFMPLLAPDIADDDSDKSEEQIFNLNNQDERQAIIRQIKARRGQKKFRDDLGQRYGQVCMITNCTILDVLEAAHIKPYRNADDNHPSNGLLLRADIHTLFDLNLIGIEPNTLKVHISNKLKGTEYESLKNRLLAVSQNKPNKACLDIRWDQFKN